MIRITIHTKETWNKDSNFVGLLYRELFYLIVANSTVAAALPTFFGTFLM